MTNTHIMSQRTTAMFIQSFNYLHIRQKLEDPSGLFYPLTAAIRLSADCWSPDEVHSLTKWQAEIKFEEKTKAINKRSLTRQ